MRRIHNQIGHQSNSVFIHLLRGARADRRLIDGVSKFKHDDCAHSSKEAPAYPTAAPSLYVFNYVVLIDILEEKYFAVERYSFFLLDAAGAHTTWSPSCELEEDGQPITDFSSNSLHTGRCWIAGHPLAPAVVVFTIVGSFRRRCWGTECASGLQVWRHPLSWDGESDMEESLRRTSSSLSRRTRSSSKKA